jgi:hypothetical protein
LSLACGKTVFVEVTELGNLRLGGSDTAGAKEVRGDVHPAPAVRDEFILDHTETNSILFSRRL